MDPYRKPPEKPAAEPTPVYTGTPYWADAFGPLAILVLVVFMGIMVLLPR